LLLFNAHILCLGSNKAPYFIGLHPAYLEIADVKIMVCGASRSHVRQQFHNRILSGSRHSASGTDRAAFNQTADDLRSGLGVQAIHTDYYAKAALECQENSSIFAVYNCAVEGDCADVRSNWQRSGLL
jgi:hypothetical protein